MNFNCFLFYALFIYCGWGIKSEEIEIPIQNRDSLTASTSSTPVGTSKPTKSPAYPEYEGLISAQDVLTVEDNADEKIEKIVNTIKEISSSCDHYQAIKLNTDAYSFSNDSIGITISLGEKNALFYNFLVTHWNDEPNISHLTASTLLRCNSSTSMIEVALPNNIKISSDLKITDPSGKLIKEGNISVILKNAAVGYQLIPTAANTTDVIDINTSKLYYDNTETSVKINEKFQTLIYNKLDVFLNKMEISLGRFFAKQLATEIKRRDISPIDTCSKIMKKDPVVKLVNATVLDTLLKDVYVIPKVDQETWNNVNLSAGPITIFELFPHDSAEFLARESYKNYPYNSIFEELISRIKTNHFKGQLVWYYNSNLLDGSNPLSITFSAENLQIDVTLFAHQNYFVDANIEKIQIKTSEFTSNESEKRFINVILSQYLKSAIAESIAKSVDQKLRNNLPSFICAQRGQW